MYFMTLYRRQVQRSAGEQMIVECSRLPPRLPFRVNECASSPSLDTKNFFHPHTFNALSDNEHLFMYDQTL